MTAVKLGMAWPLSTDAAGKYFRSEALMALSGQRAGGKVL